MAVSRTSSPTTSSRPARPPGGAGRAAGPAREDAHAQLIGCAFEDFLTCEFEPDGQNIVDDYLKRRGWKEPVAAKHYLEALRRSVMSLYEVVGTTPGSHFVARDLVRGGEPMRVRDKLGSRGVAHWDRLAARMLPVGGESHMAGGACRWTFEDSTPCSTRSPRPGKTSPAASGGGPRQEGVPIGRHRSAPVADAILGEMAPLFTGTWLTRSLGGVLGQPMPNLVNFDGDKLIFCGSTVSNRRTRPRPERSRAASTGCRISSGTSRAAGLDLAATAKAAGGKARAAAGRR